MTDPYNVLGILPTATDEEVKTAYRQLAKKYHPDNYVGNPLADVADEKMKEINDAYDEIMKVRKSGKSGSTSADYAYTHTTGASSEFADVRRLISANRLDDAEQLLDGVQISSRNAEWNFLKGYILHKRGWLDEATGYYERACALDPYNAEYRKAYDLLKSQSSGNFGGYNPSHLGGCSTCNICTSFVCADMCCECFGGDLIPCC